MPNHRSIFLLLAICSYLSACTNDESSSLLELNSPVSTRMDVVYGDWQYQVEITVNSEAPQSFVIDPAETNLSVLISGVRANEQNSIDVLWRAILDGFEVDLSMQTQVFTADGNTLINAPHESDQFDFDNDGSSNLFELAVQTCIWSDTDTCVHPDLLDTSNILLNGEFLVDAEYWWSTRTSAVVSNGELCIASVATPEIPVNRFATQVGNSSFVLEANSSYMLSFDARAQDATEVDVGISLLVDQNFIGVFQSDIELFTSKNRYDYSFNTANRNYDTVGLTFNLGTGLENLYCFDNFVLEKVDSE